MSQAFHLALPVQDLSRAKQFYVDILGAELKRSSFNWVDVDFYGNQLSLHLVTSAAQRPESTMIDGDPVPALHFGMILEQEAWEKLQKDLHSKKVDFLIGPKIRFPDAEAEQGTFFITDPDGHYLEFKYFTDTSKGLWY